MAKRKKPMPKFVEAAVENIEVTNVLEKNFMPYAMSVIISRAIPEIDGFKPSQRKILYTMYKKGLLGGAFAKSAIVSGAAMVYNPHGDAANYETMVRLTKGRESLLHPFVDSKGTFGKHYSDTPCAASRYTEVRLMKFCEEIFGGIDRDSVDFVPNFDNTETEPTILPVSFPNILVSPNSGIAVSLASNICSFNLGEICDVTTAYLKNEKITIDEVLDILKAPDFSTGGLLIYDREKLKEIYQTGKGSFKVRAKYSFDPSYNCIEVTEIPYTTTVEKIRDSIVALVKKGSVRDITDVRDEIDINGLKLTIDLKKGANPEKIMAKLFKSTPLEDSFPCNFNVLVGGVPRLMGITDILEEWCAFREECLRREFLFELNKKREKLHLLFGLKEILLDIDKAIRIVRNTENDAEVVPNLMAGFGIDQLQAEYVAEIKLRNLNKQYILKRLDEIEDLEKRINELNELLDSPKKIKKYIIKQLSKIKEKYAIPRKTFFLTDVEEYVETAEDIPDYPVVMFLSKEGYFKKCTPASLRGNDVQSYKEGDELLFSRETTNKASLIFFTTKGQVYKSRMNDFTEVKASSLGDYIPTALNFEDGERVVAGFCIDNYEGGYTLFFENGKAVRIPAKSYETKLNRKKLSSAFYDGSPAVAIYQSGTAKEYLMLSDAGKALLVKETQIVEKTTRSSMGASVMTLKANQKVEKVTPYDPEKNKLTKESKYRKSKLPSAGAAFEELEAKQQTLF